MKKLTFLFLTLFSFSLLHAGDGYKVSIDLGMVKNDQLQVICELPQTDQDEIEFRIPKIVPGTYSIYDFGRFVQQFKAFDKQGNELETDSITANRILIKGAQDLAKITYWVEDTYDTNKGNVIFEPAGTSIEEGKNFVINTFGFVGYLQGMKDMPYELEIKHPKKLWGGTALQKTVKSDSIDVYSAINYFELADGPIMYNEPDTTSFKVGNADVLVSVYSPEGSLTADFVKGEVQATLNAQLTYLGGTLPVDRYAFLIHLRRGASLSGGFGALEHSYSSLYNFPEANPAFLAQIVRDVAAHEFFHILTPLNIHSEEIGDFDFIEPKMSKHLWLYEGVTEYAASLTQVKYGEMGLDQYLSVLQGKIKDSKQYKDTLPFTEMSKNCLKKHKDQYNNVYQKGALIGMALDIRLRELSEGKYGIQELMTDLAKEYGKSVSFKDDELFDKISAMTYPEIRDFFATYVEGTKKIPYEEYFEKVGIDYTPGTKGKEVSLGHISFGVEGESNRLVINSIDAMNTFGKEMGYQEGDVIFKFDGVEIDIENYDQEFLAFKERHQPGDKIKAVVLRKDENDEVKKVKLSARTMEVDVEKPGSMQLIEEASESQLSLRKAWVNK